MRITHLFVATLIAASTAAPALAGNAEAQKNDDKQHSCHAYQQTADGTWQQLPCQEMGASSSISTEHRPTPRVEERDPR